MFSALSDSVLGIFLISTHQQPFAGHTSGVVISTMKEIQTRRQITLTHPNSAGIQTWCQGPCSQTLFLCCYIHFGDICDIWRRTRLCCIAQASLTLMVLPQLPTCWDYGCVAPHLARLGHLDLLFSFFYGLICM